MPDGRFEFGEIGKALRPGRFLKPFFTKRLVPLRLVVVCRPRVDFCGNTKILLSNPESIAVGKELSLQFVLGYSPEEFTQTLRAIAEGEIGVDPLITGQVGLEGVADAFEELANPDRQAKILVEPGRRA